MVEVPPVELAAVISIDATDDHFVLGTTEQFLPVLDNDEVGADTTIVSVTQPDGGTVEIVDNQLLLRMDGSVTETQVLSYTISDGTQQRSATVTLAQFGTAPVFIDATMLADETAAGAQPAEARDDRFLGLLPTPELPAPILALADLQLPLLGLSFSTSTLGALALFVALRRRKRKYGAVTGIGRDSRLESNGDDPFQLRHNAERVWLTGRRRGALVEVEIANGHRWIPGDRIGPL